MPGWAPCFSGFCVGVNEEIPELDEFGDWGGYKRIRSSGALGLRRPSWVPKR